MTDVRDAAAAFHRADGRPADGLFARKQDDPSRGAGDEVPGSADAGGPRRRELRRLRRRHRVASAVFSVGTLAALAGFVFLGWDGYRTTRNIRGGIERTGISDPAAPGFQAEVKPTPTELVLLLDGGEHLTDAQLLVSGPNGIGGAVVFVPGSTLIQAPDVAGATLSQLYDLGGSAEVHKRVEAILGFAALTLTEVNSSQVGSLIASSGPITITNPDDLYQVSGSGEREQRFAAGPLTLTGDDLATYLTLEVPGEAATNRSARSQLVWEAWFKAVRGARADAPDDPVVSGLSRTVAGLAGGTTSFLQLPLTRVVIPDEKMGVLYLPDPQATAERVGPLVPFPASAFPGQRIRVRVLQATAGVPIDVVVTKPLVAAGAEIVVIGNADSFGSRPSSVAYREPALADKATAMATAAGVRSAPVEDPSMPENIDVSIVLGTDLGQP